MFQFLMVSYSGTDVVTNIASCISVLENKFVYKDMSRLLVW